MEENARSQTPGRNFSFFGDSAAPPKSSLNSHRFPDAFIIVLTISSATLHTPSQLLFYSRPSNITLYLSSSFILPSWVQ